MYKVGYSDGAEASLSVGVSKGVFWGEAKDLKANTLLGVEIYGSAGVAAIFGLQIEGSQSINFGNKNPFKNTWTEISTSVLFGGEGGITGAELEGGVRYSLFRFHPLKGAITD